MIEIKDIAQWEETDSILAKNTIGRLTNEVRTAYDRGYCDCSRHDRDILERKHQQLEHIEQVNKKLYERIDKAIEYIEKQLEDTKKCLEYAREYHNLNDTEKYTRDFNLYTMLLKMLRGEDNDSKRNV